MQGTVRPLRSSILIALFLGFSLASSLLAADFTGKVIGVSDGDTITVLYRGHPEKIRLEGIDCPEKAQAYGQRAKQFTSDLAFGRVVTIRGLEKRDRYDRILGEVVLPDGRSLNHELMRAGLAWWYRKYSHDLQLEVMESESRTSKRGLWADPDPIPPWKWRKLNERHSPISPSYPSPSHPSSVTIYKGGAILADDFWSLKEGDWPLNLPV